MRQVVEGVHDVSISKVTAVVCLGEGFSENKNGHNGEWCKEVVDGEKKEQRRF